MRIGVLMSGLLASGLAGGAEPTPSVDEVVVTATFREQALTDVPASVTVLDAETLSEAGREHLEDALSLIPNLHWAGGSSRPRYFQVRGIGEREQYEGAPNPSVGFLIDDIDFSGVGMPATLFDVERVEVLRGPQGTRYGANALAGLILVRGAEPTHSPQYSVEAGFADYDTQSLGASLSAPVESLDSAWRLSVQQHRSAGFMRNAYLHRDDTNDRDELTGRFKWRWQPGKATTVDFTLLHADLDNGYDAWAIDNSRTSLADRPGEDSQRATGASVRLTTDVHDAKTLTAIAAYGDSRSVNSFDADWGNAQSWGDYTYDYFSRSDRHRRSGNVEVRLESAPALAPGSTAWLAGAYALRMDEDGGDWLTGIYEDPSFPEWNGTSDDALSSTYDALNVALFGQVDHVLAQRWRASAGMRLEQRDAEYEDEGVWGSERQQSRLDAQDRMLGGQVSLSYELSDRATTYVALARGYKAGGFNLGGVAPEDRYFDPEYLWSLESGVKSALGDGRGHTEVAVFYQWRKDLQVRTGRQAANNPGTYIFVTDNLDQGYNAGIEASVSYAATSQLDLGGTLGLLRTKADGGVDEAGQVVRARDQAHAPEYTASVFADWHHPSGFSARVDVNARDDYYFDVPADHDHESEAYVLTNVRVGYGRGAWMARLWVKNLFDEDYAVRGFYFYNEPPFSEEHLYMQLGAPRQVGIEFTWRTQ